ncbi:hypothetical protein OE88DRAFT_1736613 [Heliocybe sulcata]|uniref:Uncharacterized protein n=1 Tax=Heliocybe sulcata TaxID=5364 RepID=A0A5C3MVR7_9AGAM|nr:hypothetical protein OE88DRAFT_1736613 [Heliocybe sulcata]
MSGDYSGDGDFDYSYSGSHSSAHNSLRLPGGLSGRHEDDGDDMVWDFTQPMCIPSHFGDTASSRNPFDASEANLENPIIPLTAGSRVPGGDDFDMWNLGSHNIGNDQKKDLEERGRRLRLAEENLSVAKGTITSLQETIIKLSMSTPAASEGPSSTPQSVPNLEACGLALQPNWEYPQARSYTEEQLDHMFWTKCSWRDAENRPSDKVAPPGSKGKQHRSQGINVPWRFICEEDGTIVDGHCIDAISNMTWDILFTLQTIGLATRSWDTIGLHVKNAYYTTMKNNFHELAYCENNWKAKSVVTKIYKSFCRKLGRQRASPSLDGLHKIEDSATLTDGAGSSTLVTFSMGTIPGGTDGVRVAAGSSKEGDTIRTKRKASSESVPKPKKRCLNLSNPYINNPVPTSTTSVTEVQDLLQSGEKSTLDGEEGLGSGGEKSTLDGEEEVTSSGEKSTLDGEEEVASGGGQRALDSEEEVASGGGQRALDGEEELGGGGGQHALGGEGGEGHAGEELGDSGEKGTLGGEGGEGRAGEEVASAGGRRTLDSEEEVTSGGDKGMPDGEEELGGGGGKHALGGGSGEGGQEPGSTLPKPRGKPVEKPKEVKTAKQLFQQEQYEKGNVTDAQFRKLWRELMADRKKEYSNRATALLAAAAAETGGKPTKARGRKKGKEHAA